MGKEDDALVQGNSEKYKKRPKKRKFPFNDGIDKKLQKKKRQKKRARIIVRNISFKATPENLREHFEKFGKIEELKLLKRPDGKLVGCAFIQYETVNQATKAILKATNKPFLDRPVYVDWALGKDEYIRKNGQIKKPKLEIKEEENIDDSNDKTSVKSEDENESDEQETKMEGEISSSDDDDDDDDGSDQDKKDNLKISVSEVKKEKITSNDVIEGCTVFIKNVPFDADDNDLKKVCRKYGPIYYAIINRESISGHSKGTGFVKFKTKESADLCLSAGNELMMFDEVLDPHPALSKEEIKSQLDQKSKSDSKKDSRNIYLAREGLIMAGSKAAEGVSPSDMAKRHKLEQIKAQVLKNLNRFVSRNRLSIHNLPLHYDDEKLKQMVIAHTGYRPHECRVMRERKITPDCPNGKSKGFGFMSFETHKEAISALRKLNNNPKIFGNDHRPIVAFSIEDRSVHKMREKRAEKSKLNNPTYQEKMNKIKGKKVELTMKKPKCQLADSKARLQKHIKKLEKSRANNGGNLLMKQKENHDDYVGTTAERNKVIRMRSTKKIQEQAQEHKKRISLVKRKKKDRKIKGMHRAEKKEKRDFPKPAKKINDKDNLTNLVDKYKKMLEQKVKIEKISSGQHLKRKKWYQD